MIVTFVAFVTSNLVTAGTVFIATAIVVYNAGRRDERAALQHQRASSAAVRRRLAALTVEAPVQAPAALPAARRDHRRSGELRLRPIGKSATMGKN